MTTTKNTEARTALRAKVEARSTDDLLISLAQVYAMPDSRESVVIASTIADVIAAREGIEDLMWAQEGTYLEAILTALAIRDAA